VRLRERKKIERYRKERKKEFGRERVRGEREREMEK